MSPATGQSEPADASESPGEGREDETIRTLHPERRDGAGSVETPSGTVHYLNVSGPLAAMGRATGEKLLEVLPRGPLPRHANVLGRLLRNSSAAGFSDLLEWATDRWATEALVEDFDPEYRRALEELADPTPLSARTVVEAHTLPDSLLWLVGTVHRFAGARRAADIGRVPLGGATSAVVTPPASPTTYHAHNLDSHAIADWERTVCVQFYHPDSGLDYVGVGAAGFFGAGYTAMNAAGLTLAVHRQIVDRFDLEGVPVRVAADRAVRGARNIDQAIEILRDHPPVAGWSFVLTEGDSGRCAVFETAPGRSAMYRAPGEVDRLGYTDIYRDDAFRDVEVELEPEYRRNALAREHRVLERLGAIEDADAEAMAEIAADFVDPTDNRERLIGRTIASVQTVSSVVFEPEHRRVWVGSGASPASLGWFVPFRLGLPDRTGHGGPDPTAAPLHPRPGWERSAHGRAFGLYREAVVGAMQDEPDKRLLIRIEHALALYPSDPALHLLGGLLALRLGRGRRAEGAFRRALERLNDLTRRAETTLYLGWALDLQEQRASARQRYREVARMTSADEDIRSRASRQRWFAFDEKKARNLSIDFVHVGAIL